MIKDPRGRLIKVGSRVRGKFLHMDIEVHGIVTAIVETEKYGKVLAIEEVVSGNTQHLPASQCRRMYGNTKATKTKKVLTKKRKGKKNG